MKPSDLAQQLRRIASKIDASKRPSKSLVTRDLRRVIAGMEDQGPAGSKVYKTWEQVENTIVNVLDNLGPWDQPTTVSMDEMLGDGDLVEALGLSFVATVDDSGHFGLSVSKDGDVEVAWDGPGAAMGDAEKAAAAKAAVEVAKSLVAA